MCLVLTTETECGAGSAKLSSGMDTTRSVQTHIGLTVLIIKCTSCAAVISILLELTAFITIIMKTEGGASDAALLAVSKSSIAV